MAAIELGCPYYLYAPDQSYYACFNVPSDPNFAGYITDITGLDDVEVRENSQTLVASDGGYHGPFWRGRRPWTITGIIMPTLPVASRNLAMERINYVMGQAFRSNGWLVWASADGTTRFLRFRQQQPTRFTTGQSVVQKNFFVAGVAADYRIYTYGAYKTFSAIGPSPMSGTTINLGSADAPFYAVIKGPITNPKITCTTTGKSLQVDDTIPSGHTLLVDLTGTYPVIAYDATTDEMGNVDLDITNWDIAVRSGTTAWQLTGSGTTSSTRIDFYWLDAWL